MTLMNYRPIIAEVYLDAIRANIRQVRKMVGLTRKIMPIVKSNAYGHGALAVARALEPEIDAFGVAFVYEGIELRRGGIRCPILVMGGAMDDCLQPALENDLTLAVGNVDMALILSQAARQEGRENRAARVHIEVDTGMGRLGISWRDAAGEIARIKELPNVEVEGIFSHLATSDLRGDAFTFVQLERFHNVLMELGRQNIHIPIKHLANSGAIMQYPQTWFDMVRPGLMTYGLYPAKHLTRVVPLQFPLAVKTRILQVHYLMEGDSISYGRSFICRECKRIAAIPVGYADGLGRVCSNKADFVVRGHKVRVVGTICMDMCMIDITQVPGAEVGDEVILLGGDEGQASVEQLAELMGTISYEVLCSFGRRARRTYIDREAGESPGHEKNSG